VNILWVFDFFKKFRMTTTAKGEYLVNKNIKPCGGWRKETGSLVMVPQINHDLLYLRDYITGEFQMRPQLLIILSVI